jgi:hypothetical protein
MKKQKVLVVLGTRPEAIKLAPVVLELRRRRREFRCVLAITSQHREMLAPMLDFFGLAAQYDLDVMRPDQRLGELTGRVLAGLDRVLETERPDWVLVQGDTTRPWRGAGRLLPEIVWPTWRRACGRTTSIRRSPKKSTAPGRRSGRSAFRADGPGRPQPAQGRRSRGKNRPDRKHGDGRLAVGRPEDPPGTAAAPGRDPAAGRRPPAGVVTGHRRETSAAPGRNLPGLESGRPRLVRTSISSIPSISTPT